MCQTGICSKIRCRLFGLIAGVSSEIVQKKPDPAKCGYCGGGSATDDCRDGTFCQYQLGFATRAKLVDFGNDWKTFLPYMKTLGRGALYRVGRKFPQSI